ncbi:MAG: 2,3-bisphosphoglycerate-independent phosphoglycerate mutase [Legionella sp.]
MLKPLVLLILDGWGYTQTTKHNAIYAAQTPQWDAWWHSKPHMLLNASGDAVGLPEGQMGNSEVGHMHIGAGRVIYQDLSRINHAIEQNTFAQNPVFLSAIDAMKQTKKSIHIMGLLSDGGVHSHENHLFAFLQLCAKQSFNAVYLHLFLDGRDSPPQSAHISLEKLEQQLQQTPVATVASISGRYYAMDRDQRWERILPVYELITEQKTNHHYDTAIQAVSSYYQQHITDEFIPPTSIGKPPILTDGDTLLFFNFRADRAREITQAFVDEHFSGFQRIHKPHLSRFISMTEYAENLSTQIAFPAQRLSNTLGEIIAKNGLQQLRLAETEKYAHVTFFFNGGSEQIYPGEERKMIASAQVATYDLKPEMSALPLTESLIEAISQQKFDVIICNFANADMVGHTGNFNATVSAIECLDRCMERIGHALTSVGGQLLITADHGNAEFMFNETTRQAHTAHTNQPVPLIFVGDGFQFNNTTGSLIDIAPTILYLLGIECPKEMAGKILLTKNQ